ncbi:hypothetical protein BCV02_01235 [Vibrio breoganii]|uniref:Uncharacterized protein n=1 Tax=Vibrio breoganii TaxID=553239 RepID=A0ABX1U2Q4_9VIBR|nr:hypothetical protein [Vibrio breoganii]NMO72902.1 hypothetical protein [Vibrio breoganii]NMR68739.1 hypothetical protein [Vibrio breoganii]PMG03933.1 hypothetical protein BCV02_01235 [Vibrio breoganii]PML90989.1 hypothetical protein BCT67_03610 [Vibrio breoganii]
MEKDKNQLKVIRSRDYLLEIIGSPKSFKDDKDLLKQLKSQGGLAKLESQERNIEPCALNTLKTNADEVIRGGFEKLDELRKNAVNAIEFEIKGKKTRKGNTATKIGQSNRISEQEKEIKALQDKNFKLSVLISQMHSQLKTIASHNGTEEERWELYLEMNRKIQNVCDLAFKGEL